MYCKKCGSEFTGDFCPKCGTPAEPPKNVCLSCGAIVNGQFCPKCGAEYEGKNGAETPEQLQRRVARLDDIKSVIKKNYDKTVEFVDVAPAEQYRESLLLQARQGE